jgi:HTH-type transcriptional regulator / antitoxin HigA
MNENLNAERELLSGPGDTILETLEELKMSQADLARRIGKTPSKVNDLITGKEPITVATSLQLEKAFGIDSMFWLTRELNYRQKLAKIEEEEALERYIDWLNMQPVTELKKSGYLRTQKPGSEMAEECLVFYGVASPAEWRSVYVDQYASADFRKSDKHLTELGSMAAWLRIGEIEMRRLKLPEFNKEAFKKSLASIRKLIRTHPEDFAIQVQQLCLDAGVAVIYTMCIPKAPISGVARWIGGNPLIQLTDRYKSNDHFWFTFFHEAGHILLHGKKEVFIEHFKGYAGDSEKEAEADDFANKWLIPEDISSDLPKKITIQTIRDIAKKQQIHPAIVLARLQHLNRVPYTFGSELKVKIILDDVIQKPGKM